MISRSFRSAVAVAIASAVSLAGALVAAQAPASVKPFRPPASTYEPPRTPWGDPDLQGIWDYQSMLNIQRPLELAGKARFNSDEEFAEWAKNGARGNALSADKCGTGTRKNEDCTGVSEGIGAYNEFWNNRNFIRDLRTSLIEDPPDGRFPPLTPEAEKRRKEILAAGYGGDNWSSWEDAHPLTRCIASQTPNAPMMYNSGTLLVQSPGWVLIIRERLDTRVIPLDGRPHVDDKIRQWNGDSRGHWEGNVLVVDTINFTDKQRGGGGSGATVPQGIPFGNLHVTEYFVPTAPNRIHYYATVEDPKTWTRPWTIMIPWEIDEGYQLLEYACHEANISMGNALTAARMAERR